MAACASCHSTRGEGQAAAGFPRIASQSADYLLYQLQSYADGSRTHAVMTPIAKALNAQQRAAVAAHYARLGFPGAPPRPGAAPAKAAAGPRAGLSHGESVAVPDLERGRLLAMRGDEVLQLQACANCHGPAGAGQPPNSPYLAAQHAPYLRAALAAWRSGERRNDPSGQMPAIARQLSEADVAAVSAYYASLPWVSGAARVSRPARAGMASPARAAPRGTGGGAAPQPSGQGAEQGAPLTGGGQGPGGGGATQQKSR